MLPEHVQEARSGPDVGLLPLPVDVGPNQHPLLLRCYFACHPEPTAVLSWPVPGTRGGGTRPSPSSTRQSPAIEMTMALRVPIFEKDPGPRTFSHRAPRISSSGWSAFFFGPTMNSCHGRNRVAPPAFPRTISAS